MTTTMTTILRTRCVCFYFGSLERKRIYIRLFRVSYFSFVLV